MKNDEENRRSDIDIIIKIESIENSIKSINRRLQNLDENVQKLRDINYGDGYENPGLIGRLREIYDVKKEFERHTVEDQKFHSLIFKIGVGIVGAQLATVISIVKLALDVSSLG